jgi:sugar phosphate isomerase/epimerase
VTVHGGTKIPTGISQSEQQIAPHRDFVSGTHVPLQRDNPMTRQRSNATGRREFLAAVACYASAGTTAQSILTPARATAADNDAWTLRLSASSINFQHLPVEQACQRIAELGFEAVDIWSAHQGCPHLDDVLDRLGPQRLQSVLAKQKLKLFSFSVYRGGYPRYAKLLGDAGGGVAIRGSTQPCEPNELTSRMRDFLGSLRAEVELAEENNSYLAIENHGNALLDSLDSLKAFVDMNSSPRLGIALAPYHVQARDEPVEKAIEICGRQLLYFYAWQHAAGTGQLPGHGPTDFAPWIAALEKVQYGGYVNPFMHGDLEPDVMSRALVKSRDYLRQCEEIRKVTGS